jgi:hypothetical protein
VNIAGSKITALLSVTVIALVAACTPLSIAPPSPEKPTLLVLPAEVVLDAQNRNFGFAFAYKIISLDNSAPPYRAIFKLPVKNDMLIVDSLLPGNYRVSSLLTIPLSVGDKTYNTRGRPANIRFRLEAGKITIVSQSLYVHTYNAIPGRGLSTTYETRIKQVTGQQRSEILSQLEALPNFSAWQVLGPKQSRPGPAGAGHELKPYVAADELQGEWSGFWRPISEPEAESCSEGRLSFGLDGSRLKGEGVDSESSQYRISASLVGNGLIRGKLSIERALTARVTGKLYDDGSILGSFEFNSGCQAEWKARKI